MNGTATLKLAKSMPPPFKMGKLLKWDETTAAVGSVSVPCWRPLQRSSSSLVPTDRAPSRRQVRKSHGRQMKNKQAVIDHLLRRKQEEGWRFDVGRTRVLAYKDLEITGSVSGLPSPNDLQSRRALALQSMRLYERAKRKAGINDAGQDRRNCRPDAGAFSWREAGKVTPPRDQVIEGLGGACAACWAFAPIGAYESSYLIENNLRADMSPAPVDASEQMLVSCTPKSGCTLGHVTKAMDLLVWNGNHKQNGARLLWF